MIKHTSTFNENVVRVVLENVLRNAKYMSPTIQKEILHILASKVRNAIREEIGDTKFCILVDEARDESKREPMAIILRFVDKEGFFKERFFHVVNVRDTIALILKNEICVLSFLITTSTLKIFDVKDMMGLVTCMVNGMDYKFFFLKIAHMLIMYIAWLIGCNQL